MIPLTRTRTRWSSASTDDQFVVENPATGQAVTVVPGCRPGRGRPGGAQGPRRAPALEAAPGAGTRRIPAQGRRNHPGPRGRDRRTRVAGDGQAHHPGAPVRRRGRDCHLRLLRQRGGSDAQPGARLRPGAGREHAGTLRGDRRHRAVQLAPDPHRREGRTGPGRRQRHRAQATGADAVGGAAHGRADQFGAARAGGARRAGPRRGGCRAGRPSAGRQGLLHRIAGDRLCGAAHRRRQPHPCADGAGRQEPVAGFR